MISARPHPGLTLIRFTAGVLLLVGAAQAVKANRPTVEVAGVRFAETTEETPSLPLRGVGLLRVGLIFDVYVAALYADPSQPSRTLLERGQAKELVIHYLRDIDREDIIEAAEQHMLKNLNTGERERIAPALARWHSAMRSVRAGDRYTMRYSGATISLRLNDELLIEVDEPELARAYFGIWLDESTPAPRLRRELLALAKNN